MADEYVIEVRGRKRLYASLDAARAAASEVFERTGVVVGITGGPSIAAALAVWRAEKRAAFLAASAAGRAAAAGRRAKRAVKGGSNG